MDPAGFIQQRSQTISNLEGAIDGVESSLLPFRVLLQDDLIRNLLAPGHVSLDTTRNALRDETEQILADVRREAEVILNDAKNQASSIHTTARKTASGVSLIDAQAQFGALIENFKLGAWLSGLASLVGFCGFFGYAIYLLHYPPEITSYPVAVFSIAIRVTILGSLAAVIGVALKIFRSNLHMLYHTLHRRQLANSIPTFVDAARTDEQRDTIFAKLVEIVSSFGSSGLIGGSEDMPNTAKIIVDSIPNVASKLAGKS